MFLGRLIYSHEIVLVGWNLFGDIYQLFTNGCYDVNCTWHWMREHFFLMYTASRKYMNDKLKFTVYDAPDIMCVSLLLLCLENIVIRQNHNFFEVEMFEV